ncbi:MAG: sugar phosphate nucleotidyltransferase [Paracoccaceae bacterium]
MNASIYPLVLCGGMGSRLWPMSRVEQPKQFQPVSGKGSLTYFQTTLQRHRNGMFHAPIVVTSAGQTQLVNRQMRDLQLQGRVIAEPMGRNTGPAVLAAALSVIDEDPNAQLLVLPSDHIIKGDLNATVFGMQPAAENGRIVLFGIPPAYPETGYGYIIDGGEYRNYAGLHRVEQFIEKPPFDLAKSLISGGFSYWASGISLFRADVIIEEFHHFDPHTFQTVSAAVKGGADHAGSWLLEESSFVKATSEPTERLVFEKSSAVALAPARDIQWDDVGAWNAVQSISNRNEHGNVLNGDVIALDTHNSLVQSDSRLVAVIGLHDIIVVDTPDALLVMNRDQSQSVKQIVDHLKDLNRQEVQSHRLREMHWGQVESLSKDEGYDMRMLVVSPGATVRVNGTGHGHSLLTFLNSGGAYEMAGKVISVQRGQSVSIPADVTLPLTNTGAQDLRAVQLMIPLSAEGQSLQISSVIQSVEALFPNAESQPDEVTAPDPIGLVN